MMMRIIKIIPVFFLLLAGVALNAHMMIPHDHHLSGLENECPVSDAGTDHHSGFPAHCHAFNDLNSEKIRPENITINIEHEFLALSCYYVTYSSELYFSGKSIVNHFEQFPDSPLLESSSLRAPPSLP